MPNKFMSIKDDVSKGYDAISDLLQTSKLQPGENVDPIDVTKLHELYTTNVTPIAAFVPITHPMSFGKGMELAKYIEGRTASYENAKEDYEKDMQGYIDSYKDEKEEMMLRFRGSSGDSITNVLGGLT